LPGFLRFRPPPGCNGACCALVVRDAMDAASASNTPAQQTARTIRT
jgi:hypothetical protein